MGWGLGLGLTMVGLGLTVVGLGIVFSSRQNAHHVHQTMSINISTTNTYMFNNNGNTKT